MTAEPPMELSLLCEGHGFQVILLAAEGNCKVKVDFEPQKREINSTLLHLGTRASKSVTVFGSMSSKEPGGKGKVHYLILLGDKSVISRADLKAGTFLCCAAVFGTGSCSISREDTSGRQAAPTSGTPLHVEQSRREEMMSQMTTGY